MSQCDSGLRDFTRFDKKALKEIAQEIKVRTDEFIRITESVLAAKGTDRISPEIAQDIISIFERRKTLSDLIPPPQLKIQRVFWRSDFDRRLIIAWMPHYGGWGRSKLFNIHENRTKTKFRELNPLEDCELPYSSGVVFDFLYETDNIFGGIKIE